PSLSPLWKRACCACCRIRNRRSLLYVLCYLKTRPRTRRQRRRRRCSHMLRRGLPWRRFFLVLLRELPRQYAPLRLSLMSARAEKEHRRRLLSSVYLGLASSVAHTYRKYETRDFSSSNSPAASVEDNSTLEVHLIYTMAHDRGLYLFASQGYISMIIFFYIIHIYMPDLLGFIPFYERSGDAVHAGDDNISDVSINNLLRRSTASERLSCDAKTTMQRTRKSCGLLGSALNRAALRSDLSKEIRLTTLIHTHNQLGSALHYTNQFYTHRCITTCDMTYSSARLLALYVYAPYIYRWRIKPFFRRRANYDCARAVTGTVGHEFLQFRTFGRSLSPVTFIIFPLLLHESHTRYDDAPCLRDGGGYIQVYIHILDRIQKQRRMQKSLPSGTRLPTLSDEKCECSVWRAHELHCIRTHGTVSGARLCRRTLRLDRFKVHYARLRHVFFLYRCYVFHPRIFFGCETSLLALGRGVNQKKTRKCDNYACTGRDHKDFHLFRSPYASAIDRADKKKASRSAIKLGLKEREITRNIRTCIYWTDDAYFIYIVIPGRMCAQQLSNHNSARNQIRSVARCTFTNKGVRHLALINSSVAERLNPARSTEAAAAAAVFNAALKKLNAGRCVLSL
ncbi:unnamed protein product, partial [Trichogramma brassicae]